jgi:N-dimethylarginine dimethylaminohydrolase
MDQAVTQTKYTIQLPILMVDLPQRSREMVQGLILVGQSFRLKFFENVSQYLRRYQVYFVIEASSDNDNSHTDLFCARLSFNAAIYYHSFTQNVQIHPQRRTN